MHYKDFRGIIWDMDLPPQNGQVTLRPPRPKIVRTATGLFIETPSPEADAATVHEVKELARQYSLMAIRQLAAIMTDIYTPRIAMVAAANAILERGYGKATQEIAIKETNRQEFDLRQLSEEELTQLAKLREKALAITDAVIIKEPKIVNPDTESSIPKPD